MNHAFVLIGAGSTVFTPGLLHDLARTAAFEDTTVRLVDIVPEAWEELHALADGSQPITAPTDQEAERLVAMAAAVRTGRAHVELAVNLPNHGLITNLPLSAVVEVPAVVGADGVRGISVGALPDGIAAVPTARALQQELVVDAAVRSDRELAVQALVLDPLVADRAIAVAILDRAVEANSTEMAAFRERAPVVA